MPDLVRNMKYSTKNRCGWGVYCKNETDKKVGRIENIQNRKIYRIEKYTEQRNDPEGKILVLNS